MADWSGHDGTDTRKRYAIMASTQLRGVSPSYELLCQGVAGDPVVSARLDTLPRPKRQPNLLLGAVRFLGGPVSDYRPFREFVLDRWDELSATMLARRTQTNEPRRCATLLPALAALPQPLALLEVGASAGLCLLPDRYSYRYTVDGRAVTVGESAVSLSCAVTGPARLPVSMPPSMPEVAWRGGLDLNPLDVSEPEDVRWLESLVWPEQTDRFDTLRAALGVARAEPPAVRTGDLTADTAQLAREAPASATLVVFHSAVLSYLDQDGRGAFAAQLAEIASSRPVVWLANESPGIVADPERIDGDTASFLLTRDGAPLAWTGPHGDRLAWLSQP